MPHKSIKGAKSLSNSTPIYGLCDFQTLQKKALTIEEFAKIAKEKKISIVQYRDKLNSLDMQKANIFKLRKLLDIPIIINDNLELLEFACGVHLGQEDIENLQNKLNLKSKELLFKFLKRKYPNKIFGISTHNELEILEANHLELDYIGLGAYKTTSTKDVNVVLGDKISYLAKISKHPVCAIGGVKCSDKIDNINYNVVGSGLFDD